MKNVISSLLYRLWEIFLRLLALLPLRLLQGIGSFFAKIYFACSPKAKKRLKEHLQQANQLHLYEEVIQEQGKMLFETPFIHYQKHLPIEVHGADLLKQSGGTLVLLPHLGAFEAILQFSVATRPTMTMYKPPKYPLANVLHKKAREINGAILAPTNVSGIKQVIKGLKDGFVVGILPDQVPEKGGGQWSLFFGRNAYTTTLPTRLQEKLGCRVLLASVIRKPKGQGFVISFFDWSQWMPNQPFDVDHQNKAMEKLILQAPAQYLWSYNRYKNPK
jgi:KDO2-lipid IV(A) lauroyltransferase